MGKERFSSRSTQHAHLVVFWESRARFTTDGRDQTRHWHNTTHIHAYLLIFRGPRARNGLPATDNILEPGDTHIYRQGEALLEVCGPRQRLEHIRTQHVHQAFVSDRILAACGVWGKSVLCAYVRVVGKRRCVRGNVYGCVRWGKAVYGLMCVWVRGILLEPGDAHVYRTGEQSLRCAAPVRDLNTSVHSMCTRPSSRTASWPPAGVRKHRACGNVCGVRHSTQEDESYVDGAEADRVSVGTLAGKSTPFPPYRHRVQMI